MPWNSISIRIALLVEAAPASVLPRLLRKSAASVCAQGTAAAVDITDEGGTSSQPSVSQQLRGRVCCAQVMSKAQLPLLTSVIMVTQAFISAPAGIRAKRSLKDRNQVLLLGYAAMIAADLTFAFMPTVYGKLVAWQCSYNGSSTAGPSKE